MTRDGQANQRGSAAESASIALVRQKISQSALFAAFRTEVQVGERDAEVNRGAPFSE